MTRLVAALPAALLATALSARSARAQCPSCSNPSFPARHDVDAGGTLGARELRIGMEALYLRSGGLIEQSGDTRLTAALERSTDTLYQHRVLRLGAAYGISARWSVEATVPMENREMLNRAFPAEGHAGVRRHLEHRGVGDVELAARVRPRAEIGLVLGSSLPTGPTHPPQSRAPYETVLQIGTGTFVPTAGVDLALPVGTRGHLRAALHRGFSLYENADGFRRGSATVASVAGGIRFLDRRAAAGVGVEGSQRAADERNGIAILNTGGSTVYGTASLETRLSPRLAVGATVRVPVWQRVTGVQLAESFSVAAGAIFTPFAQPSARSR